MNNLLTFEKLVSMFSMWIETLYFNNTKQYGFTSAPESSYSAYPSLFLFLQKELLKIEYTVKDKLIATKILNQQDKNTGFYYDFSSALYRFKSDDEEIYNMYNFTYFCIHGLDALNLKPLYELRFLRKFYSKKYTENWLNNEIDLNYAWRESNKIMWILSFLFYDFKINNKHEALTVVNYILDWLDRTQDIETGLWGYNFNKNLSDSMAATYHFLMFYYFLGRQIKNIEKIIDNTLRLQQPDGSYSLGGGGACIDLDAIDILVNLSKISEYRFFDIENSLERSFYHLLSQFDVRGGFCEAKVVDKNILNSFLFLGRELISNRNLGSFVFNLKGVLKSQIVKGYQLNYQKLIGSNFKPDHPNLWSSWFRILGLIIINERLGFRYWDNNGEYKHRRLPGLGYQI